jgi:hypothetical protein
MRNNAPSGLSALSNSAFSTPALPLELASNRAKCDDSRQERQERYTVQ